MRVLRGFFAVLIFCAHVGLVSAGLALYPSLELQASDKSQRSSEPEVVKPLRVEQDGRWAIREFMVRPGQTFETLRGGPFTLLEIGEGQLVIKRTFTGSWPLWPTGITTYSIGNHEYLDVVETDHKLGQVKFRLRSKTKIYVWEAFSF
jgi:hypothetical protein